MRPRRIETPDTAAMSSVTEAVAKRAASILQRCEAAAEMAGRNSKAVNLIAASKTQSPDRVRAAWQGGIRHFGENYLQEALAKQAELSDLPICWHFIGRVQSNKTRDVAAHFDWVHTVDRVKIARRLSAQRPHYAKDLNLCIQVNVDDEAGKSGVRLDEVATLAGEIAGLPKVRLRGLMCLPAVREDFDAQRLPFARMREALEQLQAEGIQLDTLSMGMTADYAAAIHEGATIVRIGTALFGART